jgi:hypothetical protein
MSFGLEPRSELPQVRTFSLRLASARALAPSRLTPCAALAGPPPLPGSKPVRYGRSLDGWLRGELAVVVSKTACHPELCRRQEQNRKRAGPNPQLQNPPRLMSCFHAVTLARATAGALIDKLSRSIGLADGWVGSRLMVSFRGQADRRRKGFTRLAGRQSSFLCLRPSG